MYCTDHVVVAGVVVVGGALTDLARLRPANTQGKLRWLENQLYITSAHADHFPS